MLATFAPGDSASNPTLTVMGLLGVAFGAVLPLFLLKVKLQGDRYGRAAVGADGVVVTLAADDGRPVKSRVMRWNDPRFALTLFDFRERPTALGPQAVHVEAIYWTGFRDSLTSKTEMERIVYEAMANRLPVKRSEGVDSWRGQSWKVGHVIVGVVDNR